MKRYATPLVAAALVLPPAASAFGQTTLNRALSLRAGIVTPIG